VQATLFGLRPAAPTSARVLELGCGDGGNLLPMALAYPHGRFVGVDLAAEPIARGRAEAAALGLANIELGQADIRELPEDLGTFDYVIAHGLYSWVPPAARDALLAVAGRHLAPQGVAFVSYNAYPGSYLRDMARDVLRFHVDRIADPAERMAQARALMELIVAADRDPSLAGYMRRLLARPDWQVFHDELGEFNTPVYFHEFAAHAARHGLQFLAEAHLADSRLSGLPAEVERGLASLPDDPIVREQYLDFVSNRMFRQTLLCREGVRVRRALQAADVARLWVSSPARAGDGADLDDNSNVAFALRDGGEVETADPAFKRVLARLGHAWPAAVRFSELAGDRPQRVGEALIEAHAQHIVELHASPPPVATGMGDRPVASPLARRQVAVGRPLVTTLRHEELRLDDERARALLLALDGTRSRAELDADAMLEQLARLGLLVA
jgi:SAM-dependent methyltransferase